VHRLRDHARIDVFRRRRVVDARADGREVVVRIVPTTEEHEVADVADLVREALEPAAAATLAA